MVLVRKKYLFIYEPLINLVTPSFDFCYTPAATDTRQPSTENKRKGLVMLRFGGLRKETTKNEIESYFIQFGQRINYEFDFDSNGNRLPTFCVTTFSTRIVTWLSSTLVHTVGASKCIIYKKEPWINWYHLVVLTWYTLYWWSYMGWLSELSPEHGAGTCSMSLENADPHNSDVLREKIESWESSWKMRYL